MLPKYIVGKKKIFVANKIPGSLATVAKGILLLEHTQYYHVFMLNLSSLMKSVSSKQGCLQIKICNRNRSWIFIIMKLHIVS